MLTALLMMKVKIINMKSESPNSADRSIEGGKGDGNEDMDDDINEGGEDDINDEKRIVVKRRK